LLCFTWNLQEWCKVCRRQRPAFCICINTIDHDTGIERFQNRYRNERVLPDPEKDPQQQSQPPVLKPIKSALTRNLHSLPDNVAVTDTKRPRYSAIAEQLGFLNDDGSERLLLGQAVRTVDRLHRPLERQKSRKYPA
jgi:hypothetical protein